MAISKMNKFTLLTFHAHKPELLKQLQVFGDVHLKTPDKEELEELSFLRSDISHEQISAYEVEMEKVRFAAEKMKAYVEKPGMTAKRPALRFEEFDRYAAEYDYESVYQKVRAQDEAIAGFRAEVARRQAENETLSAWRKLDVEPRELEALEWTGSLVGTVNKQAAEEFFAKMGEAFSTVYLEQLDTVKDDTSLLMLFPAEDYDDVFAFARELGFTKAAFPFRGKPETVVEENQREIERLGKEQESAVGVIKSLVPEHQKLQIALDYFDTVLERERACQNFLKSDTTLMIEGWVPAEDSAKLRALLDNVCPGEYFLEEQEVERDSAAVPIKLKNNGFVQAFESITSMYSVPRYNEIDPTPILAPFYWLFFGMMVGDIGYGAVILLATTLALKFIDFKEGMRNFMRFFRYLSIAVIVMGFVYGGAFGVTVFAPVPIYENGVMVGKKAILDSQLDITTMLIVSIAIGLIHLSVGLISKTYMGLRDGDPASGIFDGLFWLIALLSGIGWLVFWMVLGNPAVGQVCRFVFFASLIVLAATQGRSSPSIAGKIGNGLYGVYGITGYVGDVVSYTRIVALSLSSAYIAYAFNLMTGLIVGDFGAGNIVVSVIRLIFGIVVVLIGQTLNLGLAMLGGYVHSCRLQYVEFFGKFYEGGGVVFRPLMLKTNYIRINK